MRHNVKEWQPPTRRFCGYTLFMLYNTTYFTSTRILLIPDTL